MKRSAKRALLLFGVFSGAVALNTHGAVDSNPYHAIVERNVFDLKPPPPPPAPTTTTNTPPPNVKLTGITSMLGVKRAFFMVAAAAQPGKPPGKEESFIIEEGQRQGVIEVLEINQKAATVKIKNDGAESTLALDTSPKLPTGPGGSGGSGAPGAPRAPGSLVAPANSAYNPRANGGAGRSPVPVPNPSPYNSGGNFGSSGNIGIGGGTGLSTLPSRDLRTGNGIDPLQMLQQAPQSNQPTQPQAQQPPMTPEEQMIAIEAERIRTAPMVQQGLLPPLPPTPITPPEQGGNQFDNPSYHGPK